MTPLFCVSCMASPEVEDRLTTAWDPEDVSVVVYQQENQPLFRYEHYLTDLVKAQLLQAHLQQDCDLTEVSFTPIEEQDWQVYWQQHFSTQKIGPFLLLPEWEQENHTIQPDEIPLIIRPGLGFGTGDHFTTNFCLAQLPEALTGASSFIDAGTGSGILALATQRLGLRDIIAFDYDNDAIQCAIDNFDLNGGAECIRLEQWDIAELPGIQADVVCANLYDMLLIKHAETIVSLCKGTLIITGIRVSEIENVLTAFAETGWNPIKQDQNHEWFGAVLKKG